MIFHTKIYMQAILYSYFIYREIILYLDKNHTLFANLAVTTLIGVKPSPGSSGSSFTLSWKGCIQKPAVSSPNIYGDGRS